MTGFYYSWLTEETLHRIIIGQMNVQWHDFIVHPRLLWHYIGIFLTMNFPDSRFYNTVSTILIFYPKLIVTINLPVSWYTIYLRLQRLYFEIISDNELLLETEIKISVTILPEEMEVKWKWSSVKQREAGWCRVK